MTPDGDREGDRHEPGAKRSAPAAAKTMVTQNDADTGSKSHDSEQPSTSKHSAKKKKKAVGGGKQSQQQAGGDAGIPASIKIRIASLRKLPVAAEGNEEEEDVQAMEDDEDDADAEALRIDALATGTSPTSVASAPTSPADDSGLNTPNGSEGSHMASGGNAPSLSSSSKRRRLEDPPMFLEKTYEMLEKCSPEIAGWSTPLGDSFIVKKPIEFAEHVIPVYFKHKNFSSFVRQLNFYGFRKVRVDAETAASVDPKEWWEFRHDKFVRGRKDLLREIKRRTIADGRSTIERAEMDELRAEVFGLREQVQQLNKNMMSMMQVMMSSRTHQSAANLPSLHDRPTTPSSTHPHPHASQPLPSMGVHGHALLQLHQGLPPPGGPPGGPPGAKSVVIPGSISSNSSSSSATGSAQDGSKHTPASTYQLRPLQSVMPSVHQLSISASHLSPVLAFRSGPGSAPAGSSYVDRASWESYTTRNSYEHHRQRFGNPYGSAGAADGGGPSDRSNMMVPGLKRTRGDDVVYPSTKHLNGKGTPDAAVRQLSMTAAQTRSELLGCIIARILGFIRIQQHHAPGEVDAVADAVVSDIQQLLARVQEPNSPAPGKHSANSEAACMYRVEILKFISRELPRAVQDSVEKRIPPHVKKSLNRSLLALLVQKAQAALENQMRVETSPTPHSVSQR